MNWTIQFFQSSLGSKYLMALTGAGIYFFVIGHILGNYNLFFGQEAMNAYALGLKQLPFGAIWIARAGLVVIFVVHIFTAIRLTKANRAARPVKYVKPNTIKASLASRTMPLSGLVLLFFLIYHLAHFTWRVVAYKGPLTDSMGRDDVYTMVVQGFQQPLISLFYMVAMILVGFHLSHGAKSMFQSLGLNHPKYQNFIDGIPPLIGWVVSLAGMIIPLSVLIGVIK